MHRFIGKFPISDEKFWIGDKELVHQVRDVLRLHAGEKITLVGDNASPRSSSGEAGIRISNLLSSFIGKRVQSYPPYSSKAVKGKSLYWWARENRLDEIKIPSHEIEIYDLQLMSTEEIRISRLDRDPEWQRPSGQDLRFKIQENIINYAKKRLCCWSRVVYRNDVALFRNVFFRDEHRLFQ